MKEHAPERRPRRPLREVVADIDRDILHLLLRRHNLLLRMHNSKGFLEPAEEKQLRESWEAAVSRVSRDARLSGRFFSLMQEVEFMPRPAAPAEGEEAEQSTGAERRTAFNLAPARQAVKVVLPAPLACETSRAWLYLAAASGQPLRLAPLLMNDPLVDCVKALNQLGAALNREENGVTAHATLPAGRPDKVLHMGDSAWNFYLLLAHYLGCPSRAKFTGDTGLKLADFSAVRRFVPQMGARLVQVVPRSEGLPVRVEASGLVPDSVTLPADVPAALGVAILLAAPFYDKALTLDLSQHPEKDAIQGRALALLKAAQASVSISGHAVSVTPAPLRLPAAPQLPMEPQLAAFLLALPLVLGGETRLDGSWCTCPEAEAAWELLQALGLDLRRFQPSQDKPLGAVGGRAKAPLAKALPPDAAPLARISPAWRPLPVALAACAALQGIEASLPLPYLQDEEVVSFLHSVGLECAENGILCKIAQAEAGHAPDTTAVWNAPTALWALALALTACARGPRHYGFRLGNPGILTTLYPAYWALYNALPEPALKKTVQEDKPAAQPRRRILTSATATLPEPREED